MLTTAAVISRITANSFLNAGQKKLSTRYSAPETNFKTYFLLTLFTLPVLLIFYFRALSLEIILWAFVGGIFGALGNAFLIGALKCGELSVLGPVNSYKAVVGLIFAAIIIGEVPNAASIFGICLIIFGSYFVFDTTEEGFTTALFKRRDIQFRILALLFTGLEAVFIKQVIILSGAFCSFLLWVIFGCLFSYVILKIHKKTSCVQSKNETKNKTGDKNKSINKNGGKGIGKELGPFLPLAALVFIMQLSTNYVFVKLPVGAALSLFQLSNVLNVFLGCKMFKEGCLLKKLAGSIIMITGSIFIILKGS